MSLPGSACGSASVRGGATLEGDSVGCATCCSPAAAAQLAVGGSVRLEELSKPVLALDFRAEQFRAIDVRSFLTLVGDRRPPAARGPVFGATLTGEPAWPTAACSTSPTW